MPHRSRRLLVTATASVLVTLAAASAPAGAAPAPPDGRAYERVSEQDTKGVSAYQSGTVGAVLDDDHVITSYGTMPVKDSPSGVLGTTLFSRTASGWKPSSLLPADAGPYRGYSLVDATNDGSRMVFIDNLVELFGGPATRSDGPRISLRDENGQFTTVQQDPNTNDFTQLGGTTYGGMDAAGRTLYLSTYATLPGTPDPGGLLKTYRWTREDGFSLVASGDGDPTATCDVTVAGTPGAASSGSTNAVSADGKTVFLQAVRPPGGSTDCPEGGRTYVNRNGQTLPVSFPTGNFVSPDATGLGAFVAASPDGSSAYFVSTQRLDASDGAPTAGITPAGDLYRWTAPTEQQDASVTCVTCSAGPSERVITARSAATLASRDGSVVWLIAANNVAGQGPAGIRNLFVVADGVVRYVAKADDLADVSPDGRRLTYRRNGGAYTASLSSDGGTRVDCLSCTPGGTERLATFSDGLSLTQLSSSSRGASTRMGKAPGSISGDGRTVLFSSRYDPTTGETLETSATFRWTAAAGTARVFANGLDQAPASVSADGRTIFGFSYDKLTADTTQDSLALFAARIGGGFPAPPVAATPCAGDACRPAIPAPVGGPTPGSTSVPSVGNAQPAPASPAAKPTVRLPRVTSSNRATFARTGRLRLRVTAAGTGTIRLRATARIRGRTTTVAQASAKAPTRSGARSLTLRLSSRARNELRRIGRLRVTVRVALSGAPSRTTTLTLTRKRG